MSLWDRVQHKVDDMAERKSSNISEIVNESVKKTFNILGGTEYSTKRLPDNIVSFIGAAGGTGVSTLVANVATTLKDKGYSVLVIDANILYPSQYNFLGYKLENKNVHDLVSFMNGKCNIGESIRNEKDISLLFANNRTIMDLISIDKMDKVDAFSKSLDVIRDFFDVVLIDVPNALMLDIVHTCLYVSDSIYLVWDEALDCIPNTEILKKNMLMCGVSYDTKLKLIINKRTSVQYPKLAVDKLGLDLVSVVPFEVSIIDTGLSGGVYVKSGASMSKNASEFVSCVDRICDRILTDAGAFDSHSIANKGDDADNSDDESGISEEPGGEL